MIDGDNISKENVATFTYPHSPILKIDDDNIRHVVYESYPSSLLHKSLDSSCPFDALEMLFEADGIEDFNYEMDSDGTIHLVVSAYYRFDDYLSCDLVYIRKSTEDPMPFTETIFSSSGNCDYNQTAIDIDNLGGVHILLASRITSDSYSLTYFQKENDGWQSTEILNNPKRIYFPSIRVDSANVVHIAYVRDSEEGCHVEYSNSEQQWLAQSPFWWSPDRCSIGKYKMVLDENDIPFFLFHYRWQGAYSPTRTTISLMSLNGNEVNYWLDITDDIAERYEPYWIANPDFFVHSSRIHVSYLLEYHREWTDQENYHRLVYLTIDEDGFQQYVGDIHRRSWGDSIGTSIAMDQNGQTNIIAPDYYSYIMVWNRFPPLGE